MNNRTMLPALKNNAAACYQGPVKIEFLHGAGLLCDRECLQKDPFVKCPAESQFP